MVDTAAAPEAPTRRARALGAARRWTPSPLTAFAGGTGLVGSGVLIAVLLLAPPQAAVRHHPVELGALALALLLGELKPIPVSRGDNTITPITISTTFAVALVILGPLSFAMLVQAVVVGVDDLRSGRRPLQLLFNAGQYALSLFVARVVFSVLSGTPVLGGLTAFHGDKLLPGLVAGAVFALVNDGLVSMVVSLASGQRITSILGDDPRFKLETSGMLVGLAPIAALLLKESVLMLPLLVLPIFAVGRTAHLAVLREQQSLHDPLTGLANRVLFRLRVQKALESQQDRGIAVLMLDLDHFKDVNDTLGHHVGDELLCEVASRITTATAGYGEDAEVARLGGDEFAVLLVVDGPEAGALEFADRLLQGFAEPVDIDGTRLSVQASIGITTTDGGRLEDVHSALKQADIALYEAKQERARASVFRPGTMSGSAERVRMLPELREAIDHGQLAVVYQPQVEASTGRVVSVEALVRWDHPTQGRLGPGTFIDLAESSGLIAPITTFVLEEALAAAARWTTRGMDIGVSVNLSARQLSDLALPDHIASLLRCAGVPAQQLTVEVTESSLMSDARAARTILSHLRDMGVQLSIDDFGTGYSSLVLLQQLDVDELKVDRSFVTGMGPGGHDEILVRSIIELGHNLGLTVVAEGVETDPVAGRLRDLSCDRLQGYLFGRPMERHEVDALLDAQRPRELPTHPGQRRLGAVTT